PRPSFASAAPAAPRRKNAATSNESSAETSPLTATSQFHVAGSVWWPAPSPALDHVGSRILPGTARDRRGAPATTQSLAQRNTASTPARSSATASGPEFNSASRFG